MTNPKTDHHASKPTPAHHQEKRAASDRQEKQTDTSANMTEACDRLGQKLDDLANLMRVQIEAGKQTTGNRAEEVQKAERLPSMERGRKMQTGRRGATQSTQPDDGAVTDQTGPDQDDGARAQSEPGGAIVGALPSGAQRNASPSAMDASRVADAISRAQSAGQEQAASMQQALEAIMAHLETQAASATLKVDVADIMSRLRDLEEQQQSIQRQFSSNRWGPS
jgi:hypothetical protein